ncbi:MAG: DNA topoisomerase IV subunit B, partial [Armatimonadetes bacterium]|nr:DNA topoisomerase IV subunit B [Armatimonadota bacterium]
MAETATYDVQHIQVLEGLEGVRRRPAMYIGSTGPDGLHHLLYEVVDNAVDEALAGYCTRIAVVLRRDGSAAVLDDGRGIPVGVLPKVGRPAVEVVLTTLHAGGKFGGGGYRISGGLHGVGVSVTNALSEWLTVEVYREGKTYRQRFERGKPVAALRASAGALQPSGTRVEFKPDPEVMTATEFNTEVIAKRLEDIAYLNAGLEMVLEDERTEGTQKFKFAGGIKELVRALNRNRGRLNEEPIHARRDRDGTEVEFTIQYNDSYLEHVLTFVNTIPTTEGGTHLVGFRSALTRTLNDYARRLGMRDGDLTLSGEDVREGLTAVLSLKLPEPQFEGQTKTKLGNSEVEGIVKSVVNDA